MLAGVKVMRVDILHLYRNRVAARSGSVWNGPPVLQIGVGQDDYPVSECDPSAMLAHPPQLDEAERLTQPVDGFSHVGINEFWGDANRPRCTTDQHAASSGAGTALAVPALAKSHVRAGRNASRFFRGGVAVVLTWQSPHEYALDKRSLFGCKCR
jgi:hypothetical protein